MIDKDLVQQRFGRAANDYATSEVHARGESLNLLVQLVKPERNWHVLDVATGAGHTAFAFAPLVSIVVASDLTEAMLAKTAELARGHDLTNIETRMADAEDLPFTDASFDLLTCRIALHHFPQPEKAIAEFARVLRPAGVLGLTDNVTVQNVAGAAYYNKFERIRDPSHQRVYAQEAILDMLTDAGFRVRDSAMVTKELEFNAWANRQRVDNEDRKLLHGMLDDLPKSLQSSFKLRRAENRVYFSLREAVIVASRPT